MKKLCTILIEEWENGSMNVVMVWQPINMRCKIQDKRLIPIYLAFYGFDRVLLWGQLQEEMCW